MKNSIISLFRITGLSLVLLMLSAVLFSCAQDIGSGNENTSRPVIVLETPSDNQNETPMDNTPSHDRETVSPYIRESETVSLSPSPTDEPTPEATPTSTPTFTPTTAPTIAPTAVPTADPTQEPTSEPSPTPYEYPAVTQSIPVIRINTVSGNDITSKESYSEAKITVESETGAFDLTDAGCNIKGHGNTTWRDFRKIKASYRLKLDKKTNLGGIPGTAGRDYVLLANYADVTMLRNYVALTLGKRLENVSFTSDFIYVNLILNGKDKGLYLLCTKVKLADSRINIETDATGVETDTGYLLELDKRASQDTNNPYFGITNTKYTISVKNDGLSDAQLKYISDYVNNLYQVMKTGDRDKIEALADMDSMVDMFILEEFVKDRDVGFASFYMIKQKGGRLRFVAPWDFDLSLGNDIDNALPTGLVTEYTTSPDTNPSPFYLLLWNQKWFRELVLARFKEVKPVIESVISDTVKEAEALRDANDKNNAIYHVYGKKLFKEPKNFITDLKNYDDHVGYLISWMNERLKWLEDYFTEKAK